MEVIDIPLKQIYSDPEFNCRGDIAPVDVVELSRSIDEIGLQQPISVEPHKRKDDPNIQWRILIGHRRFEAFKLLSSNYAAEVLKLPKERIEKYSVIPCTVQKGLSSLDARAYNLIENLDRKQLNVMQEARAIRPFVAAGWAYAKVANKLNQSYGWVQVRVAALKLEPEIQRDIEAGFLTQEQIKDIASLKGSGERFEVVKRIKEAKERGERVKVKELTDRAIKKANPNKKAYRLAADIFKKMDRIRELVGNGLHTRCMAWCAGEISDLELEEDLKQYCLDNDFEYQEPKVEEEEMVHE